MDGAFQKPFYRMNKCGHLGDVWSRTNFALRIAESVPLSFGFRDPRCRPFVEEVVDLLEISEVHFEFVAAQPNGSESITSYVESVASYQARYFPTKVKHSPAKAEKLVAFSCDAQWRREEKVPSGLDTAVQDLALLREDYRFVRVGLPMSIGEIVRVSAAATLVLSVDNGIAHVARSVGTPLYLIEHRWGLERGFPTGACSYTKVTIDSLASALNSALG